MKKFVIEDLETGNSTVLENSLKTVNYFEKAPLLPCIVQSVNNGDVLMLGYMNKEALETTIETGFITFYSRSRDQLWTKGETSGNKIELVSLYHDCDKDTFLAKGLEWGATCHTGDRSCFDKGVIFERTEDRDDVGETEDVVGEAEVAAVITKLFNRIERRKKESVEGSYTNYLFEKGVDKICKKIGEEGAEVIIAAKTENAEVELLNESADLLYHMLVLLSAKDLSVKQLYGVLEKRFEKEKNRTLVVSK